MKRYSSILYTMFGKLGFLSLVAYFVLLCITVFVIYPANSFIAFAEILLQYYVALRYVTVGLHFITLFIAIRLISKLFRKRLFLIRKKMLSFLLASSLVQLFSYFCFLNVAPNFPRNIVSITRLQDQTYAYGLLFIEWLALIVAGYLIAFYVGTLARGKFKSDVILAPKQK